MNIVSVNPKSSCYKFMVAHIIQFQKILLVSTLSNQVLPTTPPGSQDLGLQAHVGILYVQFSPNVPFFFFFVASNINWWVIEELPHQSGISGHLVSLTSEVDNSSGWDALHPEIRGDHSAHYSQ